MKVPLPLIQIRSINHYHTFQQISALRSHFGTERVTLSHSFIHFESPVCACWDTGHKTWWRYYYHSWKSGQSITTTHFDRSALFDPISAQIELIKVIRLKILSHLFVLLRHQHRRDKARNSTHVNRVNLSLPHISTDQRSSIPFRHRRSDPKSFIWTFRVPCLCF